MNSPVCCQAKLWHKCRDNYNSDDRTTKWFNFAKLKVRSKKFKVVKVYIMANDYNSLATWLISLKQKYIIAMSPSYMRLWNNGINAVANDLLT